MADIYKIKIGDVTHNLPFLPLSGGTMTGDITYDADSHGIYFYGNCGIEKWSGYGPCLVAEGDNTNFWVRNGTDRSKTYKIYHAGNLSKSTLGLGNVDNTADANKSVNYANSAGSAKRCSTKQSSSSSTTTKYYKVTGLIEHTSNRQATYIITTRWNENYYVSVGTCDGSNDKLPQITRMHNSYSKIEGFSYKSGVLYIKSAAYNNTIGVANITNLSDTTHSISDSTAAEFNAGTAVPIWNNLNSDNSFVSLSGQTLTVKINGVEKSLTNTNTWPTLADLGGISGITKKMVTDALGYTPPTTDTNTWRGITDTYNTDNPSSSISLSQSGAKALYDSVKYRQYYSINLESLSTSYFYPVYFGGSDLETNCEIHSPNVGGEKPWNQNYIHFLLTAQGWSDTAKNFIILNRGVYDSTEITIGAIAYGNRQGAQCVWLRGGLTYRMICNKTPIWNGSNITYGDEVYTVGTNYDGGSNTNVTVVWKYGDDTTKVATIGQIPTKTSQLTNDSNFTTATGHTHTSFSNNIAVTGKVSATQGFYEESDERLKSFKEPLKVDLDKLSKLRKSYFTFNNDPDNLQIGVSAQEIQSLYPEIVAENENGNLTVAYDKLSVIALDAVDQLNNKCNNLETELQEVKEKLNKVLNTLNL